VKNSEKQCSKVQLRLVNMHVHVHVHVHILHNSAFVPSSGGFEATSRKERGPASGWWDVRHSHLNSCYWPLATCEGWASLVSEPFGCTRGRSQPDTAGLEAGLGGPVTLFWHPFTLFWPVWPKGPVWAILAFQGGKQPILARSARMASLVSKYTVLRPFSHFLRETYIVNTEKGGFAPFFWFSCRKPRNQR